MDDIEYGPRYVAFLDVLGFSDIASSLTPEDPKLWNIYFILSTADFVKLNFDHKPCITTTSFSDNVIASAPMTPAGLFDVLFFSFNFAEKMLLSGHLCRGAVVKGLLHHSDHAVFGRGLVDAYQMESQVADVARVVVSRETIEDMHAHKKGHELLSDLSEHILQAKDGPHFINILMPLSIRRHRWTYRKPADVETIVSPEDDEAYLASRKWQTREIIEKLLYAAGDRPKHFRKVRWLAEEFNARVATHITEQIRIYDRPAKRS